MKHIPLSLSAMILMLTPILAQQTSTSPYFPLNVGDKWTYRVIDLKAPMPKADAKKKVVVEVERPEPYVLKSEKDKDGKVEPVTKTGFILKSTSGGKTTRDHVIVLGDGVHRIHAAGTPINPPLLFFKIPPTKTWEANSVSGNTTIKGTFTWRSEKTKVPFGAVDAIVVSFTNNKSGEDRVEIDYWFTEKVGMVKQRIREKDREIALELESYKPAK